MLISHRPRARPAGLSFVPFVAWRSSVTQLRCARTWLDAAGAAVGADAGSWTRTSAASASCAPSRRQDHELDKFDKASRGRAGTRAHERVDIRVSNTSAMNFSFFVAMGLVLWFGGEQGDRRRDHRRHAGLVPHLHDHPADAGAPARPDGQLLRPRLDLRRAAVRAARPGARRSPTRPAPRTSSITEGMLRFENVGFALSGRRQHQALQRHQLRGAAPARRSASSARPAAASRPSPT